jgi:hypothetical protein
MANEFKVKKGLIVTGSGGTIFDIQGSQGQLFSVTDSLTGELFSVNDISGIPILTVSSDDSVLMGTYGAEAVIVSGSNTTITNLIVTGTTLVSNLNADYLDGQHGSFYASAASLSSYVPTSRTITINGNTQALSSNVSFTVGGGGTVTQVNSGNGMNFSNFTTSGTITMGTPSSTTLASTNATTTNSHTHAFAPGGTTAQYITGAGTLVTFPTITNGTVTSVAALTLGTTGTDLSSTVANGTTTPVITLNVPTASATNRGVLSSANWTTFNNKQAALNGTGFVKAVGTTISYDNSTYYLASNPNGYTTNVGTVTSVSGTGTVNGITLTGNITSSGALTLGGTLGNIANGQLQNSSIQIGTTVMSLGTAYASIAGLSSVSSTSFTGNLTGTASLATSATTALNSTQLNGQLASFYYPASNPNGYTTNTGTVTAVNKGNGMDFTNFSTSGTITLGTPSSTTLASTNATTTNSHTHAFAPGGTTAQYITGAGTLVTFPTIPTVNNGTLSMATSGIATGSASFTANQSGNSTFTVNVPATDLSIGVSSGTQVRVDSSTGSDVNIPVASATLAGIVTTGAQTFAGVKTFSSTISGSINGSAASASDATNASYINVTDTPTTNANFYVTFSDTTNANSRLWSDAARLYYNPSIDTLYASNLNGLATNATQATNATNVGITNDSTTNGNFYLTFSPGAGNQALKIDSSHLTFNPSTNTLTVPNLAGTASNATLLDNIASNRFVFGNNGSGSNGASTTFNPYELSQYKSGFWDVNGASWTPTGDWYWGLTTAHQSNTSSYNYSGQQVYRLDGTESYFRTISAGSANTWRKIWHDGNITPVPTSRTITINGNTQALSSNVSFTVGGGGTVTSVAALTLGTSGTDLNSSVANATTTPVITLNVPNASATARGVISTGTQTIAGLKTFSADLVTGGNFSSQGYGMFRGTSTGDRVYIGDPYSSGPIGVWDDSTNTGIAVYDVGNGQFQFADRNIRCDISTGYVCVGGATPSGAGRFEVNGDNGGGGTSIYASDDIVAFSDISVKENIRPIFNVLGRVVNSRGVIYDRIDSKTKNNIGFIAQELEEQFPELVTTNPDGTKAVKYQNATAVLFEAVKEQQKQIDSLQEQINNILSKLDK